MVGIVIYQLCISAAVGVVGAVSDAAWIRGSDGHGIYPQVRVFEEDLYISPTFFYRLPFQTPLI